MEADGDDAAARMKRALVLLLAACSAPAVVVDAGTLDAGAPDSGLADAGRPDDAGTTDAGTTDAGCHVAQPSLACVGELFRPLDGGTFPFDAARVAAAMGTNETSVAPQWALTAHHVLEADSSFPYGCFFAEWQYAPDAGAPFTGPGCGELLAGGGHPHAPGCRGNTAMSVCVDQVPFAEAFDLVLHRAPMRGAQLDVAATAPVVGDAVWLVGNPIFSWLSVADRAGLSFPLVSEGRVLAVDGRGLVTSCAAYPGNSGGPLLNASGELVGVIYTRIGDLRGQGTVTPPALEDWNSVGVLIDARTRALISDAR